MKSDTIVIQAGQWRLFDHHGSASVVQPYPRITAPTRVLIDFQNAFTGVLRFEGPAQYARAMIERHVRQEGWQDGPSHILIHGLSRLRSGGQAFFTAVDLEAWQKVMRWAARERDHCLIHPTGALLADVPRGQGRILRLGRRLLLFARTPSGFVYEDVYSATDALEDLRLSAQTLGGNISWNRDDSQGSQSLKLEWINVSAGEADDTDEALIEDIRDKAGAEIVRGSTQRFSSEQGVWYSSIPPTLARLGVAASANPVHERVGWWSESMSTAVLAALAALSLGLGAAGYYTHYLAADERDRAQALAAEVRDKRATIRETPFENRSDEIARLAGYVAKLGRGAPYAPTRVLASLRRAAGNRIRIHRVQLESSRRQGYELRVDGMELGPDNEALRRFLSKLRADGWRTIPLAPASGEPGGFSYRLAISASEP